MRGTTYFAIFEPSKTGYGVYFPDLPGCITVGKNLEEVERMAEEALGLHLWGMEKDNEEIPEATNPPFEEMTDSEEGSFVMPVTVYMPLVRNEMDNKAVKKTLTIPYWLNQIAEENKVNFSQILQTALKECLGV
ncbi:MAG: type II toxin-antitoxin system HicB family antitoxin [Clostridiales bacterium]|nr:type II toxin-antitoxin system HicB family antitoxin [Clostridiales bacterium]